MFLLLKILYYKILIKKIRIILDSKNLLNRSSSYPYPLVQR